VIPTEARFVDLYDRYQRYVASYCARRTSPERVDDAVSEVFLTAWRRIGDMPDGDATLPWLYGVAYKVIGHQWRSGSRKRSLEEKLESLGVEPVTSPEEFLVLREESERVLAALARLSATDKEILLLAAWEELSHDESAEVLGIKTEAVRQRFHKAKTRLTREFNKNENKTTYTPAAEKGGVR
jgi:RNA polymerase sigma-70 factor (ECF subfamily)